MIYDMEYYQAERFFHLLGRLESRHGTLKTPEGARLLMNFLKYEMNHIKKADDDVFEQFYQDILEERKRYENWIEQQKFKDSR